MPGYSVAVDGGVVLTEDGSNALFVHPFTGQPFRSETAALSWNLLMLATALGCETNTQDLSKCDPLRAFATGRCSFAQPQYCKLVDRFASLTTVARKHPRAGWGESFQHKRARKPENLWGKLPPGEGWDK